MRVDPEFVDGACGQLADAANPEPLETLRPPPLEEQPEWPRHPLVDGFQQVINGLPEQIALVDEHWDILAVNSAWIRTAALYGYSELQPGSNYLDFCRDRAAEGHKPAGLAVDGILKMEREGEDSFHYVYHGKDRWEGHSFQLRVNRLQISGRRLATITRYDVTELVGLRQMREGFSQSLLEGQADERRRIAREIHDSTQQMLVGIGLALGELRRTEVHDSALGVVGAIEDLLNDVQNEIRAISYLAHPPLLKELGLSEALTVLANGFGRRAGLNVSVHVDPAAAGFPAVAGALYRFVQEALSNVHHHARATEASIGIFVRRSMIHAVVVDNGIGMPEHVQLGVGVPSMRSRLVELGGRMAMRRRSPGTALIASLPSSNRIRAVGDLATRG